MLETSIRQRATIGDFDVSNAGAKYIAARLIRVLVLAVNKHKLDYSTIRYVHREVIRRTKMAKPKKAKKIYNLVTAEEIDRFLAVIKDPQFTLLVRLMLSTGARVSEITGALVSDINWETRTVRIKGKAGKERLLVLSDRISESLRLFLHGKRHRYIFENRLGRPFSVRMVELYFRRYKEEAGISKPFAPHDARRFLFSKLSEHPNGLDVSVRCLMAGHEDPKTHQIYQKIGFDGALPQIREALHNLESKNILK